MHPGSERNAGDARGRRADPPRAPGGRARRALWICALAAGLVAACGGSARVTLSLEPARDSAGVPADTSSLRTLTIHLESEGDRGGSPLEPIVVPLARDAQSQLDPIEIDGVESMRIDVWGCVDTEDCARALLQFRGCTPTPIPLAAGSEVGVRIFMYPASDPRLQVCPPLP